MSDTPEELRRTKYLDDNGLDLCWECCGEVPADELVDFSDERICKPCYDLVKRTCAKCKGLHASWCGTENGRVFICADCQKLMNPDELKAVLFNDQSDDHDQAMDHEFESEEAEQRFIEDTREQLRGAR